MDCAPARARRGWYGRRPLDLLDVAALLRIQLVYWLRIYPQARRELAAWERRAGRMPPGLLREQALGKLTGERLNAEGAALFAVLAPPRWRRPVVRLLVTYQVLYDYLDAVNEQPAFAELHSGLQLHRALSDAVLPDRPMSDSYLGQPDLRGGGYIHALTRECRRVVRTLPAATGSADVLARATERCAQAQSRNHAALVCGESSLIDWSVAHAANHRDSPWWELAAGGVSSLGIHALLASSADPASTIEDAVRLDAAYFPAICALSTLLDSLVDYYRDAGTTNRSFISHYHDADHAAERLVATAAEATERIKPLRNSRTHAVILAAIVAYYLSSPSAREGFPAAAADSLMRYVGPLAAPMHAAMRARRYAQLGRRALAPARLEGDVTAAHKLPGYS